MDSCPIHMLGLSESVYAVIFGMMQVLKADMPMSLSIIKQPLFYVICCTLLLALLISYSSLRFRETLMVVARFYNFPYAVGGESQF